MKKIILIVFLLLILILSGCSNNLQMTVDNKIIEPIVVKGAIEGYYDGEKYVAYITDIQNLKKEYGLFFDDIRRTKNIEKNMMWNLYNIGNDKFNIEGQKEDGFSSIRSKSDILDIGIALLANQNHRKRKIKTLEENSYYKQIVEKFLKENEIDGSYILINKIFSVDIDNDKSDEVFIVATNLIESNNEDAYNIEENMNLSNQGIYLYITMIKNEKQYDFFKFSYRLTDDNIYSKKDVNEERDYFVYLNSFSNEKKLYKLFLPIGYEGNLPVYKLLDFLDIDNDNNLEIIFNYRNFYIGSVTQIKRFNNEFILLLNNPLTTDMNVNNN